MDSYSRMKVKVLQLDDDPFCQMKVQSILKESQEKYLFNFQACTTSQEFFSYLEGWNPDCILLDLILGKEDQQGEFILNKIRKTKPDLLLIVFSQLDSIKVITQLVRQGASDYICKGVKDKEFLSRFIEIIDQKLGLQKFSSLKEGPYPGETLRRTFRSIEKIYKSATKSVLITGESGTGKELVAQMIGSFCQKNKPFVPINCASLTDSLLEAEFFGAKKGSYTGAVHDRKGIFEQANNGWIFLDEVACLSSHAQAALLRALELGEIRPLGAKSYIRVKTQIIAASNEDLNDLVEKKLFRQDLLQRLKAFSIHLPALRERGFDERKEILYALLVRLNSDREVMKLTPELEAVLLEYDWRKGNVREMWNTLQAMAVKRESKNQCLTIAHLPSEILDNFSNSSQVERDSSEKYYLEELNSIFRKVHAELNYPVLQNKLLVACLRKKIDELPSKEQNLSQVAEKIGLTRWNLRSRLEKLSSTDTLPSVFYPFTKVNKKNCDSLSTADELS